MNEKKITLSDGKEVTVKRLPLGKFGELILILEGALRIFTSGDYPDFGKLSNNDFVALIPRLLSDALPEMIGIMALVSGLEKDYVETIGIDDASEIILAFVETNNIGKLFGNIKKMMPQKTALKGPANSATSTSNDGSSSAPTNSQANTAGPEKTS